ncbi:hypothetical protein AALA83_15895 [Oscillospiraceae bacterium 44-5]
MNARKIVLHARMEYSLWLTNPRMSILLVLLVLIHSMVIQPLAQAGGQIGVRFHLLEPLAALCNSTLILLILPLGFLILMAGFPRMDRGFLLQLYRVGRLNWVLGELLYLCMAAATYLGAVLLGTALCSLPYAPITSPGWSAVATDYVNILGESALKSAVALLPKNLYQQMGPGAAVAGSFLLLFLCLVLMGAILLAASLLRINSLGIAVDAALLLVGAGFVILDSPWMWGFPCAHALIWLHYNPYFRTPVCPLWVSGLYFLLGAALMTALAWVTAKRRSFDSMLEFD